MMASKIADCAIQKGNQKPEKAHAKGKREHIEHVPGYRKVWSNQQHQQGPTGAGPDTEAHRAADHFGPHREVLENPFPQIAHRNGHQAQRNDHRKAGCTKPVKRDQVPGKIRHDCHDRDDATGVAG